MGSGGALFAMLSRGCRRHMVLTVEPGIYIAAGAAPDPRWNDLGVRIEDVVLVTPSGMECLSCAAPREIADVEKAIQGRAQP